MVAISLAADPRTRTASILDGLEVAIVSSITGRIGATGAGVRIATGDDPQRVLVLAPVGLRVPLLHRLRDRRRVQRHQLRHRRAHSLRQSGRVDIAINGSYWPAPAPEPEPCWRCWRSTRASSPSTSAGGSASGWARSWDSESSSSAAAYAESPHWLFIHGRADEVEQIVSEIEDEVRASVGRDLPRARGGDRGTTAAHHPSVADRALCTHAVPQAHDPRHGAVRRLGLSLQPHPLRTRRSPGHLLQKCPVAACPATSPCSRSATWPDR